jgi:hypothetical protein
MTKKNHYQPLAKSTHSRLTASPDERAEREQKIASAVRTILDCIGEDPDREGLLRTPERYAQAVMWMTKGYEERLAGAMAYDLILLLSKPKPTSNVLSQMSSTMPYSRKTTMKWCSSAT